MTQLIVITADSHASAATRADSLTGSGMTASEVGEAAFGDYIDPEHREAFEERIAAAEASMRRGSTMHNAVFGGESGFESMARDREAFIREAMGEIEDPSVVGAWDPERRIKELEADGCVADVIFPNGVPFAGAATAEHRRAGTRAYNRWLAEFCSYMPERHAGVAVTEIDDIEHAVRTIRSAGEAGLRGVSLPPYTAPQPGYNHPRYEPVWQVCEELDLPVHVHVGGSTPDQDLSVIGGLECFIMEVTWYAHRPLWQMIFGGVFERHPNLKFALVEQGCTWIPDVLDQMDGVLDRSRDERVRSLSLEPSEYWQRQCFVSAFGLASEIDRRHGIGVSTMMWGSDYPHLEASFPHSREHLQTWLAGVPEPEARLLVGENAARLYGFDLDRLAPIAARVCPDLALA